MVIELDWNGGSKNVTVEESVEAVLKEVGLVIHELGEEGNIPNRVTAVTPYGSAYFPFAKRGHYVKNGVDKPALHIDTNAAYCNLHGLQEGEYPERYLTCVNLESNNYKFYHFRPQNANGKTYEIQATYGRIGVTEGGKDFGAPRSVKQPYKPWMFWPLYYEKLSKGYEDSSDIYLDDSTPEKYVDNEESEQDTQNEGTSTAASIRLFEMLQKYAKHVVEVSLQNTTVTAKQVSESKKIWEDICDTTTVDEFNGVLKKLFAISPRKTRYITDLLAYKTSDFPAIIDREESLIKAMEAVLYGSKKTKKTENAPSFANYDIEVYEATPEQRESVLRHLSDTLKPKVKDVYRVIPRKQQAAFDAYLKKNKIKTVKQFWHGSKNENWFSILKNGLSLNPNAAITGKMLGNGIYFAPSSMKSWGYTSYHGTYWAGGSSSTAFMGLYAAAYGKPLEISQMSEIRRYSAAELATLKKNCVHAHGGDGCYLRNDEIVFFSEDSMVLNYLVTFGD